MKQDILAYHRNKYKENEEYINDVEKLINRPLVNKDDDVVTKKHDVSFLDDFNKSVSFFVADYFQRKSIDLDDIKYTLFQINEPIANITKFYYNIVWIFTDKEIYAFGVNSNVHPVLKYGKFKIDDIDKVFLGYYYYEEKEILDKLTTKNDFIMDKPKVNSIEIFFNNGKKLKFEKSEENESVFEELADFLIKFDK